MRSRCSRLCVPSMNGAGWVFVDVQPENFLFGQAGSADEDKIFLVGFGLSNKFTDFGGSIKPQTRGGVQGAPEFLSLKCHRGWNAGRCDDLESLGYVIVSMLKKGSSELPWCGSTSIQHGLDMKRNTSLETLCQGCPVGMLEYIYEGCSRNGLRKDSKLRQTGCNASVFPAE